MFQRSTLIAALLAGMARLTGWPVHREAQNDRTAHPGRHNGKGKGRHGARKPFHTSRHTQRCHGKPARHRRRAAALRRG